MTKCTATTAKHQPCKAFAVSGTNPPRCASHGGASKKPGAPTGNSNAKKHGFYASPQPGDSPTTIDGIIEDLAHKQQALSSYLEDRLAANTEDHEQTAFPQLIATFELHARNASRLGRLLRTQRALSGEAADGIAGAIAQALDELSNELGTPL